MIFKSGSNILYENILCQNSRTRRPNISTYPSYESKPFQLLPLSLLQLLRVHNPSISKAYYPLFVHPFQNQKVHPKNQRVLRQSHAEAAFSLLAMYHHRLHLKDPQQVQLMHHLVLSRKNSHSVPA